MTDNIGEGRLVLHGSFTSSSSHKPMLFLALSGLPFSFRTVNLKNGVQKEAAHLAINRYGQVPVLRHRGLTLVMSNVVLDYLARTTGHFEPKTEQHRWQAREWLSWENDAITNVARVRHFARFRPDVAPEIVNFFRPQAEAFLAYEKGLIAKGMEGARPHMTAEKVEDLNSMVKNFGEDGFRQFLDKMRGGPQGDARRKQIEKVEVKGDYAVLEARDSPNAVTVQHLVKTKDGWKVGVRR